MWILYDIVVLDNCIMLYHVVSVLSCSIGPGAQSIQHTCLDAEGCVLPGQVFIMYMGPNR